MAYFIYESRNEKKLFSDISHLSDSEGSYFDDKSIMTEDDCWLYSLFSATRRLIENTFAMLKQRFRQLLLLKFHLIDKI